MVSSRRISNMMSTNGGHLLIFVFYVFFPVTLRAAAPTISGLPTSVSVGELETTNRLIYSITASDADGDAFVCDVNSTNPANGPFTVNKDPTTNVYGVWTSSPTFNFATTPIHTVDIKCEDTNGDSTIKTLSVDVIDNDELKFTSTPYTATFDASATLKDATIFTPSTSDALGHTPLSFSFKTSPSSSSFSVDTSTGKITAAQDLKYETNSPITIELTVSDGKIQVKESVVVTLTNMNNVPTFNNLPASIDVLESTASGTTLFALTPSDADAGATLQYTMAVDPVADTAKFTYNTNTQKVLLSTGQTFNYEARTYYNVTFTVSDGLATAGPFVLNVNIKNVNEPCYFDKTIYYLSTNEGSAGSISLAPGYVVSDHDGFSTATYSFVNANNSNRFTIDANSGNVGFAVNYDVDGGAMPTTVILTVVCTDPTSETGTALLQITIADTNDNSPTFAQANYILYVDQYTSPGASLGTLVPTDADSGTNADYSCTGVTSNGIGPTYYNIGSDCGVYLKTTPSGVLTYGTVVQYTITATDTGGNKGTTTVDIIYREVTTTTTTTTTVAPPTTSVWDDSGFLAAFSLCIILGCLVLAAAIYLLARCCYTGACCGPQPFDFCDCCRGRSYKRHKRVVTPESPKVKKKPKKEFREYDLKDDKVYLRDDVLPSRTSYVSYGPRSYPDFPQSVSRPPAISYY